MIDTQYDVVSDAKDFINADRCYLRKELAMRDAEILHNSWNRTYHVREWYGNKLIGIYCTYEA